MNNPLHYPHHSKRKVLYGANGMTATSQPLAVQAGLDILKQGGNAIDAIVAMAACLTVVEPCSNGIGGDAFALVWTGGKLHGLNASGPAPKGISAAAVRKLGYDAMPEHGCIPVNVPGAPSAWAALSEAFGRLPLSQVLKPAIFYAAEGYPVSPGIAEQWSGALNRYKEYGEDCYIPWMETFAPGGQAPKAGEIWRCEDMARTLERIGATQADAFYRGELTEKIDHHFKKLGGFVRREDLEEYRSEWVEPVRVNYRGYDVWELPPNGQGIIALMALNILEGFDFTAKNTADTYHKQMEAVKLAFADGRRYITDPRRMKVSVQELLSKAYAEERRKLIMDRAMEPIYGQPQKGGTVYLASADGEGNMVSYIQSNFSGFGSGLVVPGTGISLHNRGLTFSLDPDHVNYLEPGKQTYHTIIPGFLTKADKAVGAFGVMGGYMQPQGHVQVLMNTIDFGLNPQAALDAPRWQWMEGKRICVEHEVPISITEALMCQGHQIEIKPKSSFFGQGQILWRQDNGVLHGGTEPRADGAVAAY